MEDSTGYGSWMADKDDLDVPEPASLAQAQERRRPGRLADVPETLKPLLRGEISLDKLDDDRKFGEADQLSAVRGILLCVALSLPIWGFVYVMAKAVVHWL